MNAQKLEHGKRLTRRLFPSFVETWNEVVDFVRNLKGDADTPNDYGRVQLDRTDPKNPVIRLKYYGIWNLGAAAAASFWTFSYPSDVEDEGDEAHRACWHNCRLQIGYDASHECTDGLKQYADGVYYCEVDLLNDTCELKRVDGDHKSYIPQHDFEHSKVNLFVGIVKDKKQTYSINCIPVAYKYV